MNLLKRLHDNLYGSSTWMIWDAQLTYTHLVVKLTDYHDNHFSYKIKLSNLNEQSVDKLIKTIVDFDVKKYIMTTTSARYVGGFQKEYCIDSPKIPVVKYVDKLNIKQILELLK